MHYDWHYTKPELELSDLEMKRLRAQRVNVIKELLLTPPPPSKPKLTLVKN